MGARLINAKKKARRRRHKKTRDRQAPPPAQGEHNGVRNPVTRAR
jgi:hypothetical protein